MPAYEHHFMPLYPPLDGEEYKQLTTQGLISFQTRTEYELYVRFLCFHEQVRVVAVTIPEMAANHPDKMKWFKQIMETAISALRLSVDPEANPIYTQDGFINLAYRSDDPEPKYRAIIGFPINPEYRLNIYHVLATFEAIAKKDIAPICALLAESKLPFIPPHYRVLSLIRAIELLYEDQRLRRKSLDAFQGRFAALAISEHPFHSALAQLRTRCAHGRSRGRANPEPFIGIGYNEAQLRPLITLLQSVVVRGLTDIHNVSFGETDSQSNENEIKG